MIEKIVDKKGVEWKVKIVSVEEHMEVDQPPGKDYVIHIKTTDRDFLKENNLDYLDSFPMDVGDIDFYPKENLAYISQFFLWNALDLRNRGIGSQIMKCIEKVTREKNIDVISGFINHSMKASAGFWKKMGFKLIEIKKPKNRNLKYVIYKKLRDIPGWNEKKVIEKILKL